MKRPAFRITAVAVLEEAFDLLRACPPRILVRYYLGAVPFVLAGCGFVLDLSRNPAAGRRSAAWALSMAVLYLWLKLWHRGFARGLRAQLGDDETAAQGHGLRQTASYLGWQGLAPWLLVVATIATVPFGWVYAFFHALSVTGDAGRAWRQARDWPRQNHLLVGILFLLSSAVAINVVATVFLLPALLDSLLGIETAVSQDPASLLNSTLVVVAFGATYLLIGPVAKAAYVLRAFYGDSKLTGEDLKSRIAEFSAPAGMILMVALIGGWAPLHAVADTVSPAVEVSGSAIDTTALDAELDRELAESDYDWLRLESDVERERGFLGRMMQGALDGLAAATDWLSDRIAEIIKWLRAGRENDAVEGRREGIGMPSPRMLVLLASLAVVAALIYVLTRRDSEVADEAAMEPDLNAMEAAMAGDDAAADRMPYDEWLERARELMATGDARRAARAVYLATLSYLAHSELLLLARHKSNRDYRFELEVKGRRWPQLLPAFADSVRVIERVWYGRHRAGEPELDRLSVNLETMRGLHGSG